MWIWFRLKAVQEFSLHISRTYCWAMFACVGPVVLPWDRQACTADGAVPSKIMEWSLWLYNMAAKEYLSSPEVGNGQFKSLLKGREAGYLSWSWSLPRRRPATCVMPNRTTSAPTRESTTSAQLVIRILCPSLVCKVQPFILQVYIRCPISSSDCFSLHLPNVS